MAGNVKEWCWNGASGRRVVLGGAWNERSYLFANFNAQSPFERSAWLRRPARRNTGLRRRNLASFRASPAWTPGTRQRSTPVSDDDLAQSTRVSTRATGRIFGPEGGSRSTTRAKLTRGRRSRLRHVRKRTVPVVSVFPRARDRRRTKRCLSLRCHGAEPERQSETRPADRQHRLPDRERSGRFSTRCTRGCGRALRPADARFPHSTNAYRDTVIQMSKDLRRAVDYLETRPEIDRTELVRRRCRASARRSDRSWWRWNRASKTYIFVVGGFYLQRRAAEVDQVNFAPRVRCPVPDARWALRLDLSARSRRSSQCSTSSGRPTTTRARRVRHRPFGRQ